MFVSASEEQLSAGGRTARLADRYSAGTVVDDSEPGAGSAPVQAVTSEADVRFQHESITTLIDRVVADEIQRLPHPRGTILQLAFWEGRSYPRSPSSSGCHSARVKSHARRALLRLRTDFRSRRDPPRHRAARRSGTRPNG